MWSENCTIAPYGFVKAIQEVANNKEYSIFTGFDQNDVSEFLLFIIDCLHESLKREVDMKINGTIKNNKDSTPLHTAAKYQSEAVQPLLDAGADITIKNNQFNFFMRALNTPN